MFKNIQKQLLLKYPLLWNTKFVPMVIIGILMNIIYFFIGYYDGTLDFTKRYKPSIDFSFFSFSVIISLIILIIWLVNYFNNNSFKRYYAKSKYALFYEWIQIVTIVLLLSMFYFPFEYGKQLHKRNYYSKEEAIKRCEIISNADFFIDGSFGEAAVDTVHSVLKDTTINGEYKPAEKIYHDYVEILGKKYSPNALINRNVAEFRFFTHEEDSLRGLNMRKILASNNTFEVKKLMRNYYAILKEHNLPTNLTEDKWFQVTYNFPEFKKFELINPVSPSIEEEFGSTRVYSEYDSRYINKVYSEYYIEHNVLKDNYYEISKAYTTSVFKIEAIIVLLYSVFGFSMLIFSFRVTSGRSWLIALISFGIFNIIIGIFAGLSNEFTTYPILLIITFFVIVIYFIAILFEKSKKSITTILLNLIIWLFGGLIPVAYLTYLEIYRNGINYLIYPNNYDDPHYKFLEENISTMFLVNLALIIIGMYFMSKTIRTWKGISEE